MNNLSAPQMAKGAAAPSGNLNGYLKDQQAFSVHTFPVGPCGDLIGFGSFNGDCETKILQKKLEEES